MAKSLSLKMNKDQKQTLGYMGAFAGGQLGGMFLRGRYAGPLGLLGAIGGIAMNKPYVAAASMGMLFSVPMDFITTGGAGMRTNGSPDDPFSIKGELNNGIARTKTFFQAMGHKLWLDKIFNKKGRQSGDPLLDEFGDPGTVDGLGFLGSSAAATLDRIEQNVVASARQFQAQANGTSVNTAYDDFIEDVDLSTI